jgi:RNA polymerase sigma factor (sigma-70 family)
MGDTAHEAGVGPSIVESQPKRRLDRARLETLFKGLDSTDKSHRRQAWNALFKGYSPIFLGYLRHRYRHLPEADHDEIVNDVFVNAARGLSKLLAANDRHAFFYTIFINAIRQHLREQDDGHSALEIDEARERVLKHGRRFAIEFDDDATDNLARQFRFNPGDLDRATHRVLQVAGRSHQRRVSKCLSEEALVGFERALKAGNEESLEALRWLASSASDVATHVDLLRLGESFKDCFHRTVIEFQELFPHSQRYIDLKVIGQLSNKDIAQALGRSPGATREFLSSCRKKFRLLLEKLCGKHSVEAAEEML